MSYGVSSEVAEDYVQALQSLTMNSRYEISNLTVIAKENTEHALAISEALRNHIKQTAPQKKLPAFYVLDSVVKNVGTPYTLFFGRQLFSTFMEAYALVDLSTRRKMDEMLKTWKEPVPGSIDIRPVFPPEVTRPIENALIKARTSAVQAHQEKMRSQQQNMGRGHPLPSQYRATPPPGVGQVSMQPVIQAPPGYDTGFSQPQYPGQGIPPSYQNQNQINGPQGHGLPQRPISQPYPPQPMNQQYPHQPTAQHYPQQPPIPQYSQPPPAQGYPYPATAQQYPQQYSVPTPVQQYPQQSQPLPYNEQPPDARSWSQQPQQMGYRGHDNSLESLNSDVASLIVAAKAQWAQHPLDSTVQVRLKALLDLERVLSSQQLPPDQISLIRNQVAQLSEAAQPPRPVTPPVYVPPPAQTPPSAPPQPLPTQPSISSILGSGALAALLARQNSVTPQPAHPSKSENIRSPPRVSQPYTATPSSAPTLTPASNPLALLERLRASGLLPGGGPAPTSTPPLPLGALTGKTVPGFPPTSFTPPAPSRTPLAEIPNDVVLKPASLKMFRPHLISNLYERLGLPCTSCGRRFQTNEEGKKKKTAHMDWHFKINQRMIEAEKRGQHRSWYVDELDWIKSRELDEDQHPNGTANANGSGSAGSTPAKPKLQYMPAPVDSSSTNSVCPICQEKFEPTWLVDAQEFVWMDAKDFGGRIYHVSCHAEAYKDNLSSQVKRGTPEPVLGKRKAEDEHDIALRSKIKTEPSP